MVSEVSIKIDGLAEFTRNLKKLDGDLAKAVRVANNKAAEVVVAAAKPKVPSGPARGGHAVSSIKAKSTRTEARVAGGGNRYPYYPWLDFGGRVGRRKQTKRRFIKEGRYIYPAFMENKQKVHDVLVEALIDVARDAGIEVAP